MVTPKMKEAVEVHKYIHAVMKLGSWLVLDRLARDAESFQ